MRVGFIVRNSVIKSQTSGIANALVGWAEILKDLGHHVDIITDKPEYHVEFNKLNGKVYVPNDPLYYSKHNNVFQFLDGFNFERCVNFRDALMNAFSNHIYDVLICNEPESAFLCYQLELYKIMRVVYYTHEPNTFFTDTKKHIYRDSYFDLIGMIFKLPIYTAMPSSTNIADICNKFPEDIFNFIHLPLPLPSKEILKKSNKKFSETEGVMFNGRIESRKNAEYFVKVMADIRDKYGEEIKINFLTKETHVVKAERICQKYNYTNFKIYTNLTNSEKYNLLKSSRISFHPAIQETYGIAAFESLRYHPTILLKEYDWHRNFTQYSNLVLSSKKSVVDDLYRIYNTEYSNDASEEFNRYHDIAVKSWLSIFAIPIVYNGADQSKYMEIFRDNVDVLFDFDKFMRVYNTKQYMYLTTDVFGIYNNLDKLNVIQEKNKTKIYYGESPKEINISEDREIIPSNNFF